MCQSPTNLIINTSTTEISISWIGTSTALQGYVVQYQTLPVIPNDISTWEEVLVETNSTTITGLTPGTSYIIRVGSLCDLDEICYSIILQTSTE
jgi:hypothetical protein